MARRDALECLQTDFDSKLGQCGEKTKPSLLVKRIVIGPARVTRPFEQLMVVIAFTEHEDSMIDSPARRSGSGGGSGKDASQAKYKNSLIAHYGQVEMGQLPFSVFV